MLLLIENQARDYLIVTTLLDNFGKPLVGNILIRHSFSVRSQNPEGIRACTAGPVGK